MAVLREVAERGSFSAAADALHLTQSPASQQTASQRPPKVNGPGLSSTPALHPDYSDWPVPLWPGLEPVRWPPATRLSPQQIGALPQIFGSLLYLPVQGPPAERVELAL